MTCSVPKNLILILTAITFTLPIFCPLAVGQSKDKKQTAIEHLEQAGAILTKSEDGRVIGFQLPENVGLRPESFFHLTQLTDLEDLQLCAILLSNDSLKFIGNKLPELRTLNLFGNPLDSESLASITGLQKLETLYLYRTFIDDVAMDSIQQLKNLRRLNVFDTFLTDEGLRKLGTCKQLTHLCIGNSKTGRFPRSFFTQAGIDKLRADLPNASIVYWGSNNDQRELPLEEDSLAIRNTKRKSQSKRIVNLTFEPAKVASAPNLSRRESGHDWPVFLGPNGDGKSNETDLNTDWNSSPPKLLWHMKTGTGFAAPSVARGRLMLYHRVRNTKGPERFLERLSCIHSETGEPLWQVDYPTSYEDLNGYGDGPRSTPVIDGDRVFILSPEGMLRCLQLADGKSLWEVNLKVDFNCDLITYGVGTTPVVYRNRVLVIAGGKGDQGNAACVIALDKRNGIFEYGVGKSEASYATPVIHNHGGRAWCLAFAREGLLVFNPDTGKKDFEFPWKSNIAGSVNAATPVVVGDEVLISEAYSHGSTMLNLQPENPLTIWSNKKSRREELLKLHWATPIFYDGAIFACSGRHSTDGTLKCIDWRTGKLRWQQKLPDRSSMIYFDQHLISLGEKGTLTLLKASTAGYNEIGRFDKTNAKHIPSYPAWTAPVLARGLLYIRGKHELICYDLKE